MKSILIVDDDDQLRQSFQKLLADEGYEVMAAPTGEAGMEAVKKNAPDLLVMDVRMPGMSGLEAFQAIREIEPRLPVIIMTAYGTTDTAIEAIKLGAYDYILKPFEIPEMLGLIEQAIEAGRLMRNRVEMNSSPSASEVEVIVGHSETMQNLYKSIGRVAPTDATVLIRGESGTGKELVARAIYQHSRRAARPFLVINCVAIPETLLESELFGYEKGAFTGANARKVGKIEQANGGTIFLDEIGDMPVSIQAKILRLLQEKSIERLGGRDPIPVDVRIIAATNRDLEAALREGRFREDLYYRLKVVSLELPPLRERPGDIAGLCEYFIARLSEELGMQDPGITAEAKAALESHSWPGNVRELRNAIQKALIFSRGCPISIDDASQAIKAEAPAREIEGADLDQTIRQWARGELTIGSGDNIFTTMTDRFAEILISEALNITGGNRSRAAKLLGLSRPTLLAKMEKYRIRIEAFIKSG